MQQVAQADELHQLFVVVEFVEHEGWVVRVAVPVAEGVGIDLYGADDGFQLVAQGKDGVAGGVVEEEVIQTIKRKSLLGE